MRESSEKAILSYFDDLLCEPAAPVTEAAPKLQAQALAPKTQAAAEPPTIALAEMGAAINLETAVGSRKSTQALGAPSKFKNRLITNQVTTRFLNSLCTPISYASFSRPTAVSRIKELEHTKKQQLQALLNSQLLRSAVESPAATTQVAPAPSQNTQALAEPIAVQVANEADAVQPTSSTEALAVGHIRREFLAWADNGRPMWAQNTFDVLLFKVAGLTLAVPLIALGHIHRRSEQLTPVFGQADWFMGLQPSAHGSIRVVNTALLVMPERHRPEFAAAATYIVTIDGLDWGLAVDSVETLAAVLPDEVTWRSERSKRPWLAGTVKAHMCALIDIPQLGQLLQSSDRKRRPQA